MENPFKPNNRIMTSELFSIQPSEPDALTKSRRAYEEAIDAYQVLFDSDDKTKEQLKDALEKAVYANASWPNRPAKSLNAKHTNNTYT
jgi:hypothetical protein